MKFLLDVMCGKLAVYLRMCDYDTAYALDRGLEDDDHLRDLARREERVLLTRDRDLAARAERSLLLTSHDVRGHSMNSQPPGLPSASLTNRRAADGATVLSKPSRKANPLRTMRQTPKNSECGGVSSAAGTSGKEATGSASRRHFRTFRTVRRLPECRPSLQYRRSTLRDHL